MNPTMCLFMFVTLLFAGQVLAKEEIIATITNDENKEVYNMIVQSDEQTDSIKAFYKDDYINGKKIERELLPSSDLLSNGLVLEQRGNKTVIKLTSSNFDQFRGGQLTIDTLFNGINGQRKKYDLELAKSLTGWKLFSGKKQISKLHIVVNKKVFIGSIGIKEIQMK